MKSVKSGVGYSDNTNSAAAGRQAAEKAMMYASTGKSDLTMAFCGGNHDPFAFLKAVGDVVGETTLIGGMTVGVITNEKVGYGGYESGVAVVAADNVRFDAVTVGNLSDDEEAAGTEFGRLVSEKTRPDSKGTIFFYDSIKRADPFAVNLASQMIKGVERSLPTPHMPIMGGGVMKDYQWREAPVFAGDQTLSQHAAGVVISGDCSVHHAISHGCEPASDYHTITSIEGPVVRELDGRPALNVIEDIIGAGAGKDWQQYSMLITLGANHGNDPYGDFNENEYVNRLIAGVNPEDGSLILFESDFGPGEEIQIMRRSNEKMLESARSISEKLLDEVKDSDPFLGIYIDCAGRTSGFCGAGAEEGGLVQETIGAEMPLLGFYSGVEVAPFMGGSRALDWTGVLIVLSEDR